MQQLALFDLDGTLVDRRAAFAAWAGEFVAGRGLDDGALTWLLDADARTTGARGPFFGTVRDQFTLREPADELWRQYRLRMPELVRCRPEDLDAIRQLRSAGWRIGIVTNGMTDNQRGKIRRTGLDRLVDAWCISGEVGIRKPDTRIFRLAAQRCCASAEQGGWMIGDDPVLDVRGGRNAGLRTILLRPGTAADQVDEPKPDFVASSVADAVNLLLSA